MFLKKMSTNTKPVPRIEKSKLSHIRFLQICHHIILNILTTLMSIEASLNLSKLILLEIILMRTSQNKCLCLVEISLHKTEEHHVVFVTAYDSSFPYIWDNSAYSVPTPQKSFFLQILVLLRKKVRICFLGYMGVSRKNWRS